MKSNKFQNYWKTSLSLVFGLIIIASSSCKKEDSPPTTQEKEEFAMATAASDAEAELVFDDVFDNVMGVSAEVGVGGTGIFGTLKPSVNAGTEVLSQVNRPDTTPCFIVTTTQISANRFPLKVVIDFGSECLSRDGRNRRGKIIIVYTGRLVVPGNSATVTFEGYGVNGIRVEGSYRITNTGSNGTRSFTIEVRQAKLTKANGNYSQWNSTKTITQVDGALTPLVALDDVFRITGEANGAAKVGDKLYQWSTRITDPLIKRFACFWIVKGTIELRKGNASVATLDYGSGVCDRKATFTVNGTAHEITLY